ncbi:MAG: hypothetical protein AVDCRST_MAG38-634, partial [uncultured Solirubrobacteraceae bacterium]
RRAAPDRARGGRLREHRRRDDHPGARRLGGRDRLRARL